MPMAAFAVSKRFDNDHNCYLRLDLLGGVPVVELDGGGCDQDAAPAGYRRRGESTPIVPARLTAIPCHAWANRGVRAMRVWVPLAGA
jgi:hypothetical protein